MMVRIRRAFLLIALLQVLHSLEEYSFSLWNSLEPARILSSLVSPDPALGFAAVNLGIAALLLCSVVYCSRRPGPRATAIVWFWAILETLNGIGHIGFAVARAGYFPGLLTAPLLLLAGTYLMFLLWRGN